MRQPFQAKSGMPPSVMWPMVHRTLVAPWTVTYATAEVSTLLKAACASKPKRPLVITPDVYSESPRPSASETVTLLLVLGETISNAAADTRALEVWFVGSAKVKDTAAPESTQSAGRPLLAKLYCPQAMSEVALVL